MSKHLHRFEKSFLRRKKSIYIQMYAFTNQDEIRKILEEKAKSGVSVCIILYIFGSNNPANKNKDGNQTGFPEETLEASGVAVKWDKRTYLMHRKIAVIDEEAIFIGSTNWTEGGLYKNREIYLFVHDPEVAKQIVERFNADWNAVGVVENYTDPQDLEPPEDDPKPEPPPEPPKEPTKPLFIGNSSTMKFHLPDCSYVEKIKPENRIEITERQEAIDKGYEPCKVCKP